MTRCLVIFSGALLLSACVEDDDGVFATTYVSCQVISSNAPSEAEREADLSQCWNAVNGGYDNAQEGLAWCHETVVEYMDATYPIDHNIGYEIQTRYCE